MKDDNYQQEKATILKKSKVEFKSNWISEMSAVDSINLMRIYFFDKKSITENSWDIIVSDYLVLERKDLTLNDLDSLNWTIQYP
jgi:hypothetical protein